MNNTSETKQIRISNSLDLAGAEKAREELLAELEGLDKSEKIQVILDVYGGYSAAFLDVVFGGLVRESKKKNMDGKYLHNHLELLSENPNMQDYVGLARHYMDEALSDTE